MMELRDRHLTLCAQLLFYGALTGGLKLCFYEHGMPGISGLESEKTGSVS